MSDRLEQLRKLVMADPNDPLTHYSVGLELCNQERWDEAVDAFGDAIRVGPDYAAAYYHQGRALIKAGRGEQARETLNAGLAAAARAGDAKTMREMEELRDLI